MTMQQPSQKFLNKRFKDLKLKKRKRKKGKKNIKMRLSFIKKNIKEDNQININQCTRMKKMKQMTRIFKN